MPENDLPQQVQKTLSGVPNKVVRIDDLSVFIEAFEKTEHFGMIDRMLVEAEMKKVFEKALHDKALYKGKDNDGNAGLFIDSKFVVDGLIEIAKCPDSKHSAALDKLVVRADNLIGEALVAAKDQSRAPITRIQSSNPFKL
ncbi:MAG: hypothetical protein ACAH83_00330 [Alphaproteobacteria bacterium]